MRIKLENQPETFKLYFIDIAKSIHDTTLQAKFVNINRFYRWMSINGFSAEAITAEQFSAYEKYMLDIPMMAATRSTVVCAARSHLKWLFERGLCSLDPASIIGPVQRKPFKRLDIELPDIAKQFLASVAPHKKANTCNSYRHCLRSFYEFLRKSNVDIAHFTLTEMNLFQEYLFSRELCPSQHRKNVAISLIYLRWLFSLNRIAIDPDESLRKVMMPRLPQALPRPLSPQYDQLFQEEFLASDNFIMRSFYVMRHTGLRIGELVSLPFDCMHTSPDGNICLKVPLGKMDTERLVPLRPNVVLLIKELQEAARQRTKNGAHPRGLFVHSSGRRLKSHSFHYAFVDLKKRLILSGKIVETAAEPINPHRLRHTYATTLLTGGMNIVVLQKLLGHRAIRMTLRYAEVVPTKITEDYFAALNVLETHRALEVDKNFHPEVTKIGHRKLIADLIFILRNAANGASPKKSNKIEGLIEQIEKLNRDISRL